MESPNSFSFSAILAYLSSGREIEFSYQGKQYSITNSKGYWNFCCDTDSSLIQRICPFENKDALIAYVKTLSIEGTPIPAIFDDKLYGDSFVCIL